MIVSVIIPTFNSSSFIVETVHSVLSQKHKEIEIIIIDDYSTDNTYKVIVDLQNSYPNKIKVYKNRMKGACAARNYGYEQSCGEYIQFLDADDILSEDKISSQINEIKKYGDLYVYSCRWGRFFNRKEDVKWSNQIIDKTYEPAWEWLKDSWLGKGMGQTSIWLFHRSLFEKAGEWDESLTINQDGDFFCRILLVSKGVKFVNVNGVYYRSGNQNSISQSSQKSFKKASSLLKSYISYKTNIANYDLLKQMKMSIGNNFLMFMYLYFDFFPSLVEEAEKEFYSLGFKKPWSVGGEKFKKISRIIGFKKTLLLRSCFFKMSSINLKNQRDGE